MPQKDSGHLREGRPHAIPPLPTWRLGSVDEPEGWSVLGELPDELGISLWVSLRAVLSWVDSPADTRRALARPHTAEVQSRLSAAKSEAPELSRALDILAVLSRSPTALPPEHLARACRNVAEWADARSLFRTAAAFAESAAKVSPDVGGFATLAGKACRRAGFSDRAALWYARGFQLALRANDSPECIRALLGYGKLLVDQGRHSEARRFFRRAARRAHYVGRRRQAAAAYHDLFTIAAELGDERDAWEMLSRALRLYPVHHPQVPALAHDCAYFLLRRRYYSRAERLLAATLPCLSRRDTQLIGWATYARAVALLGDSERWRTARAETIERLGPGEGTFAAAANIHMAEAARALAQWEEAEERAQVALSLAEKRGETLIAHDARVLLGALADRVPPASELAASEGIRLDHLLPELAARLRRWKPPQRPEPS